MGPRALVSDQQVTGWSVVAQHEIAVWLTLGVRGWAIDYLCLVV